jgi:tetratricopeptide (TPR) repeat protein
MSSFNLRFCLVTIFVLTTAMYGQEPSPSPAKPPSETTPILTTSEYPELVKSALDLYKEKKYPETIAIALKATAARPNDFWPHYITGLAHMATWKMKNSSEAFARAISLNPNNKQLYYLKALADRNRNAREEGIDAAKKAVELDPSFADAYYTLGELLAMGSKDKKGAIEAYRTAIKLKPDHFKAYYQLGMHLEDKEAEELYKKAMALDPEKMACRFSLGRVLVKQNRLAEARVLWNERRYDEENTFPKFITLLERAEKLKQTEDALAQKPDDPEALLQMGLKVMEGDSWVADRRQERAIVHFRKALKIKPDFAKAQYAICKAYVQLADTFRENNKNVDEELVKLRKMDSKLADEITEYRKTYSGGLKGFTTSDQ